MSPFSIVLIINIKKFNFLRRLHIFLEFGYEFTRRSPRSEAKLTYAH